MRDQVVFIAALLFSAAFGQETVPELDIGKYIGQWYQMYANPLVYDTFEKDGVCITATYGVYNATTLSVYNYMRLRTPTGAVSDINGFAFTTEEPGKLKVDLGVRNATGSYWVYKLGPVTEYNGVEQYSYSVVSDPFLFVLFVLARDKAEFEEKYEQELLVWLYDFGFDSPINEPVKTFHSDECLYPWS